MELGAASAAVAARLLAAGVPITVDESDVEGLPVFTWDLNWRFRVGIAEPVSDGGRQPVPLTDGAAAVARELELTGGVLHELWLKLERWSEAVLAEMASIANEGKP